MFLKLLGVLANVKSFAPAYLSYSVIFSKPLRDAPFGNAGSDDLRFNSEEAGTLQSKRVSH
jgi:hypothetical protein